jgi:hypothetical protein
VNHGAGETLEARVARLLDPVAPSTLHSWSLARAQATELHFHEYDEHWLWSAGRTLLELRLPDGRGERFAIGPGWVVYCVRGIEYGHVPLDDWACFECTGVLREGARDVFFVAPNYRITELQSAVAIAQLGKLGRICSTRHRLGERLTRGLSGIPGIRPHAVPAGGYATYWYYLIGIDPAVLGVEAAEFGRALNAEGIAGSGQFYMEPVHLAYSYLGRRTAFHHSTWPFSLARKDVSYRRGTCPHAEAMRNRVYYFPLNEWLTSGEIDDTVAAVRKVAAHFSEKVR